MKETIENAVAKAILSAAPSATPEDIYNTAEKGKVKEKEKAAFLFAGINTMMEHKRVLALGVAQEQLGGEGK